MRILVVNVNTTPSMTAVGLLMRLYLGWNRDNMQLQRGADYLRLNPPMIGTRLGRERDPVHGHRARRHP